jgi:hypothetical protein
LRVTDSIMQFLFVIYYRRKLFQVNSLTWLLDRTLLAGDSRGTFHLIRNVTFLIGEGRVGLSSRNREE